MSATSEQRLVQLLWRHSELAAYDQKVILDAFCIDLVHGGVYAWAYLMKNAIADEHAHLILRSTGAGWNYEVPDVAGTAERALAQAGLYRYQNKPLR